MFMQFVGPANRLETQEDCGAFNSKGLLVAESSYARHSVFFLEFNEMLQPHYTHTHSLDGDLLYSDLTDLSVIPIEKNNFIETS